MTMAGWIVFLVDGGSVSEPAVAGARAASPLPEQRQRTVRGCDRSLRHRASRVRDGRVRRRLRQRRSCRSLRDQLRTRPALSQRRARHVHRCHAVEPVWDRNCSAPVARSPTSTTMAMSICSWRTTSIPTAARSAAMRGRARTAGPDVYSGVPSAMYRNNGDGTFTDVTKASGLDRTDGKALGVVFADYDNDGRIGSLRRQRPDAQLPVSQRRQRERSKRSGLPAGVALASDGRVRAGMGTDFGDYDGDGLLDLVVTNFESETHSLFRNLGGGLFADATFESGRRSGDAPVPRIRRRVLRLRQRRGSRSGDCQRTRPR